MGKIKAMIFRNDKNRCYSCGKKLTETELFYYGRSCEKCERKETEKLYYREK